MPESISRISRLLSASVIDRLPLMVVAFATLMLFTLSYIAVDSSVKLVQENLRSKSNAALNSINNKLVSELSSYVGLIRGEAESPIVRNALADSEGLQSYLRPHLTSLIQGYEAIRSVTLIDGVGTELVQIVKPGTEITVTGHTRLELQDFIERGEPVYELSDQSTLFLLWPVWFPPTAKHEGLLLMRIDLQWVSAFAAQTGSDPISSSASIRFVTAKDSPPPASPEKFFFIVPDREYVVSKRFELPSPLSSHESEIEYRRQSTEERNSVIQTLTIHALSMSLAWMVFFILAKWIKARYVEPIRRITAIAASIPRNGIKGSAEDGLGNVGQLQKSVQGVIEVLNTTEHSYQEKIQFTALELRRARARLEDIARSGNIIALSVDLPTGIVSYATDTLNGYLNTKNIDEKHDPVSWKVAFRLVAKQDRTRLKKAIRQCLRSGFARLPLNIRLNRQDLIFDLRLQKSGVVPGAVERVDCIALDNTEKAAKDIALEQSESRKSAIINGALDGFIALNREFVVTEVNPAAERILGRKNINFLGLRFVDYCIAPTSVKRFLRYCTLLLNCKEGHLAHQGEPIWCRDANEQNIPVDMSGSLINTPEGMQICLYIKDLRKSYEQQRAIREKTAEVQAVLELSPGGFASFNDKGHLSANSQSLHDMLGLDSALFSKQLSQKDFEELVRQLTLSKPSKNLQKLFSSGDRILRISSPKEKLVKCTQKELSSSTDERACVYYFTDITQEFQLDTLKSNFLATAAHELRTPLTTILGFSELMNSQEVEPEVQKELISSIFRHSLHLNALINDLLDLSKIESDGANIFKPERVDLRRLLQDLVLKSSIQKNGHRFIQDHEVVLKTDFEENLATIADEEKLTRAFQNLLSNATKYSSTVSPIVITAGIHDKNGKSWIKISVTDQGIGMTPEEVEHAFVRFWRADSSSGKIPGTGLGLPLVKEIVELHQGHIEIDSQYGVGTTVSIYLPAEHKNNSDNQRSV